MNKVHSKLPLRVPVVVQLSPRIRSATFLRRECVGETRRKEAKEKTCRELSGAVNVCCRGLVGVVVGVVWVVVRR